ncbi:hypothetical protein CCR95_10275 [Thiocystis minor]|nr:hypothetical protein [Thiocystis minor]
MSLHDPSASLLKFRDRGLLVVVVVVVIAVSTWRIFDNDNDYDLRRSWDFRTVALGRVINDIRVDDRHPATVLKPGSLRLGDFLKTIDPRRD